MTTENPDTDSGTGLETDEMTGDEARDNMEFDFVEGSNPNPNAAWQAVVGDEPIETSSGEDYPALNWEILTPLEQVANKRDLISDIREIANDTLPDDFNEEIDTEGEDLVDDIEAELETDIETQDVEALNRLVEGEKITDEAVGHEREGEYDARKLVREVSALYITAIFAGASLSLSGVSDGASLGFDGANTLTETGVDLVDRVASTERERELEQELSNEFNESIVQEYEEEIDNVGESLGESYDPQVELNNGEVISINASELNIEEEADEDLLDEIDSLIEEKARERQAEAYKKYLTEVPTEGILTTYNDTQTAYGIDESLGRAVDALRDILEEDAFLEADINELRQESNRTTEEIADEVQDAVETLEGLDFISGIGSKAQLVLIIVALAESGYGAGAAALLGGVVAVLDLFTYSLGSGRVNSIRARHHNGLRDVINTRTQVDSRLRGFPT